MSLLTNIALIGGLGLGALYAIRRFDLFSVFGDGGQAAVDIGSQVANGIGQSGQGVIDFGSQVANGVGQSGQGVLDFFGNLGSGLTDFFSSFIENQNMPGASGGGGGGGSGINYFDQFNELLSNALNFGNNNNANSDGGSSYPSNVIGHLPTGEAVYEGFSVPGFIPVPNNNNNGSMDMNNNNILDTIGGALTGAANYIQGGFDDLIGGGSSGGGSSGPAYTYDGFPDPNEVDFTGREDRARELLGL